MRYPFTDEQLSRILSAHAAGVLEWTGHDPGQHRACAWEAANAAYDCDESAYGGRNPLGFMSAFDAEFDNDWTPEQLLAWLEGAP